MSGIIDLKKMISLSSVCLFINQWENFIIKYRCKSMSTSCHYISTYFRLTVTVPPPPISVSMGSGSILDEHVILSIKDLGFPYGKCFEVNTNCFASSLPSGSPHVIKTSHIALYVLYAITARVP